MSDLRTAAQQALEALEDARTFTGAWPTGSKAITNLRAALAQQDEPVEPAAWMFTDREGTEFFEQREDWDGWWTPLYTAPPQRKPLPLKTVEKLIYENTKISPNVAEDRELLGYIVNAVRAVERAHGIGEQP